MYRKVLIALSLLICSALPCQAMERVVIAKDGKTFELQESHKAFKPWGFNYGNAGRLMEDFWESDWDTFANDFREMKQLGANVVRVHLQVGKFMKSPTEMNSVTMAQFKRMLKLAEDVGIYLDLTGLACYRPSDVPAWYDPMSEVERWKTQEFFWREIAKASKDSPAVFCYDLMNEPLSPSGKKDSWYSGHLLGGFDFLQRISQSLDARTRSEVALAWIDQLRGAIHSEDPQALVTVGMLPWVQGWGHLSGFVPEEVASHLDFLSIHIYPDPKKWIEAETSLKNCKGNRPVVIEETFPLSCSVDELEKFLLESRDTATGWIWHYDGRTLEDYAAFEQKKELTMPMAIYRGAIQSFVKLRPEMTGQSNER